MEFNNLINELLDILDENEDIIKIKKIKTKLLNNLDFLSDLENYRLIKTIDNKKKLYNNKDYLSYLESETNINILIQEIKYKFNVFKGHGCIK